jgi:hypothetical protein
MQAAIPRFVLETLMSEITDFFEKEAGLGEYGSGSTIAVASSFKADTQALNWWLL